MERVADLVDFILVTNHKLMLNPYFGQASVIIQSGALRGPGSDSVGGKTVSAEGNESTVIVPGCAHKRLQ